MRRTERFAEEAYAGDVVGIPNHGTLRIGDTLTEGEDIAFLGVPNFAPEILRRVKLGDPMKAKKLKEALQQMAEEGVVQVFRPLNRSAGTCGSGRSLAARRAQGAACLESMASRSVSSQPEFQLARWIASGRREKARGFRADQLFELAPKILMATKFSWRAISSSLTTRVNGRLAFSFTDIKDVKDKRGLVQFHICGLNYWRPARDLVIHPCTQLFR